MCSDYTDREAYRKKTACGLPCWRTRHKETELFICADRVLEERAYEAAVHLRRVLDEYISKNGIFKTSLEPVEPEPGAHPVIARMCGAGKAAGVGPMAAVAGAFAQHVGGELLKLCTKVIVENGGDIFLKTGDKRTVAVFAGKSPLSMKIGVEVDAASPVSVCASSGTVGPSLSFGKADAAVIVSSDACLADACATRLGNMITTKDDIRTALENICRIRGVTGALAIVGDECGAVGDINLKVLG